MKRWETKKNILRVHFFSSFHFDVGSVSLSLIVSFFGGVVYWCWFCLLVTGSMPLVHPFFGFFRLCFGLVLSLLCRVVSIRQDDTTRHLSCLVLSCLVLSCLILLSCLIVSCLVLSCLVLYLSGVVQSSPVFSLSCLILSCLVFAWIIISCSATPA